MKLKTTIRVATLIAAAAVATPAFAGDTQVSGKIYFDYSTNTITKAGTKTTTSGGNLTRTYLQVKHKLDETWTAKFKVDSAYESTLGKKTGVYVKEAQLSGNFTPEFNVKFGVIGTPWVGHQEHFEGHRHVTKTFVDTQHLDSSADAGIGIYGKIADGMVNYSLTEVNGGGYGNIKRGASQDLNARIGFAPVEGLTIDLGYRDGYKGKKLNSTVSTSTLTKEKLTQVMVTYGMGHDFRIGADYIKATATKTAVASSTIKGLSLFAWANLTDQFGAFAKYETAKRTGGTNGFAKSVTGIATEKRTVVSLDYKASKKVLLSLAYTAVRDLHGVAGDKDVTTGLYSQFKF